MMIQPLESRRLYAVDLTLSGLSANLPTSVEGNLLSRVKATAKVTITNAGPDPIAKTDAGVTVAFFLRASGGAETPVGASKATKLANLKATKSKAFSVKLVLPALALDTYTLVAKVDTTGAITETDESNNTLTAATTTTVAKSGTALFASYGFADTMTFTRTSSNAENGESGTFVDINGIHGGYIYVVTPPVLGRRQVTLTLFPDNNNGQQTYICTNLVKGNPVISINGKTAYFSAKSNGGTKLTGNPTASGTTVYLKLA